MLKPGIVSATFKKKNADEVIALCARNRLTCVEWSEDVHLAKGDVAAAARLRRATLDAGLEVAAYGSYYRLGQNADPRAAFGESLRTAAALGAPVVRIWAGVKASAEVDIPERQVLAAEASLVATMARAEGIRVAFEWHKNTLTDTNESAMDLLEKAANPNLDCLWQPTVALDEAQRLRGIELLGPRLLNLHVYYWKEGVRRPLREGAAYWREYLARVDRAQDHCALLEFVMGDSEAQFDEDAATLLELIKDYR